MSVSLGRQGTLKKNGVTVAKITAPNLSCSAGTIDLTSLGDLWNKFATGMGSYTLSFNMLMVSDDATQNAIWSAFENRTELTDLALYVDSTGYFTCDTDSDAEASMVVTGYNITFDNNSAVQVAVTLQGNGPIRKFPES